MKAALIAALALSFGLAGCALTSDRAFAPAPSQMAVADLQREIVAISKKMRSIRSRPSFAGEMPQATSPVIFSYTEPNGGYFTNYTRAEAQRLASTSPRSRSAYDEVQLNGLAKRQLELARELRRRTQSQ